MLASDIMCRELVFCKRTVLFTANSREKVYLTFLGGREWEEICCFLFPFSRKLAYK